MSAYSARLQGSPVRRRAGVVVHCACSSAWTGLCTHACCAGKEAAKGGDVPALEEISLGRFTADKDDIVLSTFKQFQAAYRGLLEGLKARVCTLCCTPVHTCAAPALPS